MPLISIVVPVYNDEIHLERCLNSLINQTMREIEVICVNDGSTDNSMDILNRYAEADRRVKVYNNSKNKGLLLTRIVGANKSSGQYITFCDSDDSLETDACRVMYDAIQKNDADIVHFDINVIAKDKIMVNSLSETVAPTEGILENKEIIENHFIIRNGGTNVVSKLYKKDLINKAFSKISSAKRVLLEDIYTTFWIDLFAEKYVGFKGDEYKLYNYYVDAGESAQKNTNLSVYEQYNNVAYELTYLKKYIDTENIDETVQRAFDMQKERILKIICHHNRILREDEILEGCRIFEEAWKDSPNILSQIMYIQSQDYINLLKNYRKMEHLVNKQKPAKHKNKYLRSLRKKLKSVISTKKH